MKNTFDSRRVRWQGPALAIALLLALLLPACNDNTLNIPDIPNSIIVLSVEPTPVVGAQNVLTGSVTAAYVIQIREAAGLGATLNFVKSTVFDPETGAQVATNYFDSADLKVFIGSDRLEANGELNVTQTTSYTLTDFKIDADLTVSVQAVDDQGNLLNRSLLVPIVAPE